MARVKDPTLSAAKWVRRAGSAGPEYEEGIRNPRAPWAASTAAAENRYKAGVTAAIGRGAFGKGVRKAGDSKWSDNALAKGPARFTQGVAIAENAYREGFAPYAAVINGLSLPERGPKGDPNNIQRVAVIAKALHEHKIKQGG